MSPRDPKIYVQVGNCARCGGQHKRLLFKRLTRPAGAWTHYATCPKNKQPILLKVTA
jgi:hypothetical protein